MEKRGFKGVLVLINCTQLLQILNSLLIKQREVYFSLWCQRLRPVIEGPLLLCSVPWQEYMFKEMLVSGGRNREIWWASTFPLRAAPPMG